MSEQQIAGMLSGLVDTATDLIKAASAAERAAWLEDEVSLDAAAERVAALAARHQQQYNRLRAASRPSAEAARTA